MKNIIIKLVLPLMMIILQGGSIYPVTVISFGDVNVTVVNGKITSPSTVIQGSGKEETKKIDIADIRNFTISNLGNLTIEQCKECPEVLTIIADENIMPHLEQDKQGKKIALKLKNNIAVSNTRPVEYRAVVKDVEKISLTGSTTAKTQNTLEVDNLTLDIHGSSQINASLDVENLSAQIYGSSDATLTGEASQQKVKVFGSSKYNAKQLKSKKTKIKIKGSSSAQIYADQELVYNVLGSSYLDHFGNALARGKVSGASKIKKH